MRGKRKGGRTVTVTVTVDKIQQLISDDENGESGNANGWLDRSDHPLMNHVILETLFVHVKPNDLKTCRLVCKTWCIQSLPSARASFHALITGDYTGKSPILENHGLKDFIQLFASKSLGCPFAKFKLGSFDPTVGLGKTWIQLFGERTKQIDLYGTEEIHFLENISSLLRSVPMLEHLKIPMKVKSRQWMSHVALKKWPPADGFKLFPASEAPSFKRLKTLEVEDGEYLDRREVVCPTFFEELFVAAENVSTIYASKSAHSGVELLEIIDKLGRDSKLKILSLRRVHSEHLEVLKKMKGLSLKHLSIGVGEVMDVGVWPQLFDLMKNSLISLQIHNNSEIPTDFPRMPDLRFLDLTFVRDTVSSPRLNYFNNSFPALRCLRFSVVETGGQEEIELDEYYIGSLESCPIMESLSLEYFVVNIRAFQQTLNVFPNLKELDMNITVDGAEILQMIWTQMTRLEKLNIYVTLGRGNNVESLVTGICADGIKKIRGKKLKTLKDMRMEVREETILALISEYRTHESIRNLTNLKYLTLNMVTSGGRYKTHLSDLTGYFGFYVMKNLRHLNISDSMISKACAENLVTHIGLESWNFQSPGEFEIIPSRLDLEKEFVWDKFPSPKFSFN